MSPLQGAVAVVLFVAGVVVSTWSELGAVGLMLLTFAVIAYSIAGDDR